MAERPALRAPHQVDEQLAFKDHTVVKLAFGRRLNSIHTLERSWVTFGHAADHVAGKLKVSITIFVFAGQIANQRQWPRVGNRLGIGQRLCG